MKSEGTSNDLLERLASEPMFASIDLQSVMNPAEYVGRAPTQVDGFVQDVVTPIRNSYAEKSAEIEELRV